ncbi:hypothetical protein SVIOM74S_03152 [Streptomyces violarus]
MDNQALTQVGEAIGTVGLPVIVFPRVNAAHARHPAWQRHIEALRAGGVHVVYGPDVPPDELAEVPRGANYRGRQCLTQWTKSLNDESSTFLTCKEEEDLDNGPGPCLFAATCSLACQGAMSEAASWKA